MSWEDILKQPRDHRKFLQLLQTKIQQALSDNVSDVQDPSEKARIQIVRDGNMLAELRQDLNAYLKEHPTYMDSPADNETRPINLDAKLKVPQRIDTQIRMPTVPKTAGQQSMIDRATRNLREEQRGR